MNNSYFPGRPTPPPYGSYGYPEPPERLCKRRIRLNANIVSGGLLLVEIVSCFLAYALSEAFLRALPPNTLMDHYQTITLFLSLVLHALGFLIPCTVMVALIGIPKKIAFPLRRLEPSMAIPAVFFSLGACFVGVTLSGYLSYFLETFCGVIPTMSDFPTPDTGLAVILYLLCVVVSPAILEELVFRGVIMQSLRRFGDGFALIVSAILFSLCHGNLIQGPNALVMGLVIGYFVLRTGSLSIGILIHFVNNGISAVVSLVSFQSEELGTILYLMTLLIYIVGGIASAIYLLTTKPRMFHLLPSAYPLREGTKHFSFYTAFLTILYLGFSICTMAGTLQWT